MMCPSQPIRPRVLVCGSRGWTDAEYIEDRLAELPKNTEVLHGGAQGADHLAERACAALGLRMHIFLPLYEQDGRAAPLERNKRMLDQKPERVIAFWDGRSTGTAHTMSEAYRRGIPVEKHVL